jgi:membrane-associated phospholipid phosphatase
VNDAAEINVLKLSGSPSFPSGHATKSLALVLPFLLLTPSKTVSSRLIKGLLALAALGVCYSRLFLGVHYLSDVVRALATALTALPVAVLLANKILGRMSQTQLATALRVWTAVLAALALGLPFL